MSQKLLVTGASGKLARHAIEILLEKGVAPANLIATTRDPSKLAELAAKGVDVRQADFNDADGLASAFAGADRIAIVSTDAIDGAGTRLKQHINAIEAAKAAGIKHIVYTSMVNPGPESKITFAGDHRGSEEAIQASGVAYTILRNSWYQENLFMNLPQALKMGQWFTSAGDGRTPYIAHADCAEALAAALMSEDQSSHTYSLAGPQGMTNAEIGALAAEVLGKPLAVINLSDEQLAEGMKSAGVPEGMIPFLIGIEATIRDGLFDISNGDFEALTGRKPTPLKAFLEKNADALLA